MHVVCIIIIQTCTLFRAGGVVIPMAVLGILLGGGLMRKFNLSLTGAGKLCSAVKFLAVCTAIPLLMIGCPTQKVGGVFPER